MAELDLFRLTEYFPFHQVSGWHPIFAACIGALLFVAAATNFAGRSRPPARTAGSVLAVAITVFYFFSLFFMKTNVGSDWPYYETAAKNYAATGDLYGRGYLYSPLFAQVLASGQKILSRTIGIFANSPPSKYSWELMADTYRWSLLGLVFVLAAELYVFARSLRATRSEAACCLSILLVTSYPLHYTIYELQTNLLLVDLILGAFLLTARAPYLSGAMIAVAALLKVYPVLFLVHGVVFRRWRFVIGCLVGLIAIPALSIAAFGSSEPWREFLVFLFTFEAPTLHSNVALPNMAYLWFDLIPRSAGWLHNLAQRAQPSAGSFFLCAVAVWYVTAALAVVRSSDRQPGTTGFHSVPNRRETAHAMWLIVLMIVISPLVWLHHFTLLLPVVLWLLIETGKHKPWIFFAVLLLTQIVPTVDAHADHNAIGAILLMILAHPFYGLRVQGSA